VCVVVEDVRVERGVRADRADRGVRVDRADRGVRLRLDSVTEK